MKFERLFLVAFVGSVMNLQAMPAKSQDYPTRPITFIVPLPPGGTLDPASRVITGKLADRLGKPIVIKNQPGAGTVVGTEAAARATPDGYTMLMGGTAGLAVNVRLFRKLPYDPVTDFEPVALVLRIPFILVVHPSLPVHSVFDLIKLAREKPGQLFYASAGIGTQPHLAMELLKTITGIEMIHVPYRGAMIGLADVLTGQPQVIFADPASALPLVREGKLRALGVSSAVRVPIAPDIPPIADAGFPGFEAVVWIMIVAPANTPRRIVNRLHDEIKAIMRLPDVKERIVSLGVVPVDSPPPERLGDFLKSEIERWGRLVEQAGIAGSQ